VHSQQLPTSTSGSGLPEKGNGSRVPSCKIREGKLKITIKTKVTKPKNRPTQLALKRGYDLVSRVVGEKAGSENGPPTTSLRLHRGGGREMRILNLGPGNQSTWEVEAHNGDPWKSFTTCQRMGTAKKSLPHR